MRIAIIRYNNIKKKDMTYEEMNEKYQQIMNPPPAPPPTQACWMITIQLKEYAAVHGVPIPDPYDKNEMRMRVQAHMDANKGKGGGGKKRTLKKKKKMMFKKKRTLKKRK
jgi:hypothetical protein